MASVDTTEHGTYRVRYRDPLGRSRSRTFKRKGDAMRFVHEVETDKRRGDWIDPQLGRATVREWAERWFETVTIAPKTRHSYQGFLNNWVLPMVGDMPIAAVDRATCREFVAAVNRERSAATAEQGLNVLRSVLRYAEDAGAIKANPATRLKLPKAQRREMHFLTAEQVRALAEAMPTEQYRTLISFAAYTGLRAGEVEGLRVKRVDLDACRVDVVETIGEVGGVLRWGPTKTYQRRSVPFPPGLVEPLQKLTEGKGPEETLFEAPDGGPIRHHNWYNRFFKRAAAHAGLPAGLRFHDLRHTCAAFLIQLGAHPRAIMERLGHSTINVTLGTYGHLFPHLDAQLTDGMQQLLDGGGVFPLLRCGASRSVGHSRPRIQSATS